MYKHKCKKCMHEFTYGGRYGLCPKCNTDTVECNLAYENERQKDRELQNVLDKVDSAKYVLHCSSCHKDYRTNDIGANCPLCDAKSKYNYNVKVASTVNQLSDEEVLLERTDSPIEYWGVNIIFNDQLTVVDNFTSEQSATNYIAKFLQNIQARELTSILQLWIFKK